MRRHWWVCALLGAAVLVLATLKKALKEPQRLLEEGLDWQFLVILGLLGLAGATCGVIAWGLGGLSRRFGWWGDGLVGVVVVTFFASGALIVLPWVIDRALYLALVLHGLPVLGVLLALGFVSGVCFGKGLREAEAGLKDDELPDVDGAADIAELLPKDW